jgi:hypothetical protein
LFIEDGRRLNAVVSSVIGFREPTTPRRLFSAKEMQGRKKLLCTRVAVPYPKRKNVNKQLATAPINLKKLSVLSSTVYFEIIPILHFEVLNLRSHWSMHNVLI